MKDNGKSEMGWKTFETPPPVGKKVNVYFIDIKGKKLKDTWTYWIDEAIWNGSLLEVGELFLGVDDYVRPVLWCEKSTEPKESLLSRACRLPLVPSDRDEKKKASLDEYNDSNAKEAARCRELDTKIHIEARLQPPWLNDEEWAAAIQDA